MMNGKLYIYQSQPFKGEKVQSLDEAIREQVKSFEKIMGYYPEFAIVRLDEYVEGKYPVRVVPVTKSCPPGHFMLCPLIKRTARFPLEGEKIPWKKK